LSLISTVQEQIEREFVQPNRYTSRETGEDIFEHLIRINFHCNQACRFCFVSTHLPPAGDEAVRRAIREATDAGAQVTLTGGEPTLNANVVEYVRLAKASSRHPVSLQTNAIRLADAALTDALVEAGLGWVQVSLHGTTAALSDAMTEAPGTFAKTVVGIDNLHRHPSVDISINFVITQRNYEDLVPFVGLVAARWPRAFVNFSFVGASSDVVPKEKALVPRYSEVLPHLSAAIAEARRLGLDFGGFESMCGVPLCLVPAADRPAVQSDIPPGYDGGEFIKSDACTNCHLSTKCFGVRRGYYDLWGADELRAV
jgi:pyruvate-formate lyase-activating enzyme